MTDGQSRYAHLFERSIDGAALAATSGEDGSEVHIFDGSAQETAALLLASVRAEIAGPCQEAVTTFDKITFSLTDCQTVAFRELMIEAAQTAIPKKKDFERFVKDVETFEMRIAAGNFADGEAGATYREIARLLIGKTDSAVAKSECAELAQQVMSQAARPSSIDQGRHNTCLAHSVEVRAYERKPSSCARAVADIALNNSFKTLDGTEIVLDPGSLKADDEASANPTRDGKRSFASQLYTITANNAYWLRQEVDHAGRAIPRGSFRFAQSPEKRGARIGPDSNIIFDFGERLVNMASTPITSVADRPYVGWDGVEDLYAQMTHVKEEGFVLDNKLQKIPNTRQFSSVAELEAAVDDIETKGLFPAIIRINISNPPYNNPAATWHALNITAVDRTKGKYFVSDQDGEGKDRWMSPKELYEMTLVRKVVPPPEFRFRSLVPFDSTRM